MTRRLGCEADDLFTAMAPIAFPGAFMPLSGCASSRPVAIIAFQGRTDLLVPYGGGGIFASAQDTFAFWRDLDGCAGTSPDIVFNTGAMSECEQYNQCDDGMKVELCSVTGVAGVPLYGHVPYFNTDGINLSQRAWAFVTAFSLNGPTSIPALPSGRWMLVLSMIGAATRTRAGNR